MEVRGTGNPRLHVVELRGDSRERGIQHGQQLLASIQSAVDFYHRFFARHLGIDAAEMRRRAACFIEPTAALDSNLMAEYEGIAAGSEQKLEDIFALSARYEITFEEVMLGDCSNIFVGSGKSANGHVLLGQNWDWRPEVMDFRAVITSRCDDQPDHIMVTECGQPGKYGFNANGIGVVSAGLNCREKVASGDQLFTVLARQVMARDTFEEAAGIIEQTPPMATVNMLLADDDDHATNFEFTPTGVFQRDLSGDPCYWHTNHCRIADEPSDFENSLVRGDRWAELTKTEESITSEFVQQWLADRAPGRHSICQLPDPAMAHTTTYLQTICSVVMDLNDRILWVSDGPSCHNPYQRFRL